MMKKKSITHYFMTLPLVASLAACGGSGNVDSGPEDSPVQNSTQNSTNTDFNFSGYVVVKSIDASERESFVSNELEVSNMTTGMSISWTEPTRKLGGECLSIAQPLSYSIGFGQEVADYTYLGADDMAIVGELQCGNTTGQLDNYCGVAITRCEYTVNSLSI